MEIRKSQVIFGSILSIILLGFGVQAKAYEPPARFELPGEVLRINRVVAMDTNNQINPITEAQRCVKFIRPGGHHPVGWNTIRVGNCSGAKGEIPIYTPATLGLEDVLRTNRSDHPDMGQSGSVLR